ncbi:hypothetical protein GCM10007863_21780 [Dyella mobilis]|nr:hypothetical protein GCM10007863_21780 [Dyella mobilis]
MAPHDASRFEQPALDAALREEVHSVWDKLSDFGADQSAAAVNYLITFLCGRVEAWNATWAGGICFAGGREDDPLKGWRVGAMQALHAIEPHTDDGHFKEILRIWDRREIDPSFLLPMQGLGKFRTYSFRRELPQAWFDSAFYERYYASVGTYDAVFVAFPINEDCESHFGFYSRKTFSDVEIAVLAYALRGIKWFHRHLLLGHGLLMVSSPLTPSERKILQLLLTDATEKRIASQAGMTPATTHQYIVGIYRKFGVSSRAGLMSLWLNRCG